MTDCLFCKIAANEIGSVRVYEDESVFTDLDGLRDVAELIKAELVNVHD